MKKLIILLFSIIIFSGFQSCCKNFDEFGNDSIFYYMNGEPVIPSCHLGFDGGRGINVTLYNDTLRVNICGLADIHYKIANFRGKGLYHINSTNGNDCWVDANLKTFHPVDNNKTYIRVLEIDSILNHFSAVFEADLIDEANNSLKITKGRMDVNFIY